jgi:outer membrane protein insertion porin family
MRKLRVFLLLEAAALVCGAVSGVPAQTHVLHRVTFAGATDYTQEELLAFTGLKPGMAATQAQIEDAAQKLGDTGLFEDVSFSGNDDGVTYTLKPAAATMPVRFGNFVWWQDDEVERELKGKVPLYHGGAVPVSGNTRQTIATALATMVAEKGVANPSVNSMLSSTKLGAAPDRIVFAIDAPAVVVHSVTFTGGSVAMQPKLEHVRADLAGQPWDEVESFLNLSGRVSDVYRNEGYLDIAVDRPERSAPSVTPAGIEVNLTAALNEGAQYHVKQLAWAGSEFLSAEDFRNRAQLRPGDPASPIKLAESLKLLRDAYGSKGYIDAKIDAPEQLDRSSHEASYVISVAQGPQYHLRSVRFPNVSTDQEKQFNSEWKMKPGDVYDDTYSAKFMGQHVALMQHGYTMSEQVTKDPNALMVDLAIEFKKPVAQTQQ